MNSFVEPLIMHPLHRGQPLYATKLFVPCLLYWNAIHLVVNMIFLAKLHAVGVLKLYTSEWSSQFISNTYTTMLHKGSVVSFENYIDGNKVKDQHI